MRLLVLGLVLAAVLAILDRLRRSPDVADSRAEPEDGFTGVDDPYVRTLYQRPI